MNKVRTDDETESFEYKVRRNIAILKEKLKENHEFTSDAQTKQREQVGSN